VFGLLATLARQNDTQAYLTEYQKYADLLRQQEYEYRSSYERLALLASCERYQRPPVNILKSDEMLIINGKSYQREELSDPSVCVQLNRERVRESDKRAGPRRRSRREH
jgi:hypothetical protein